MLSWGLTSVMLLAVASCGHGSRLYSSQDAKRAFAREGFVLVSMTAQPLDRSRILVPKSREPFTVVIARSEADAKYAYRKLRRETTRFTFDLRARNVITTSDTGLARSDKMRLRRAMAHLGEGAAGALDDDGHPSASAGRATAGPAVLSVEVTFECEDEEQGHPVGPAIIYRETAEGPRATESPGWVTIPEAKRIARRLHARYTEDC